MPSTIIFNTIAANGMETNAAIFVGENSASGWDSNNKNQTSIGFIFGVGNAFPYNFNLLYDNDYLDTPIVDNDVENAPAAQA
ncbi:hypothetical protein J2S13_001274 [Oikeobacillus pervagus]|uniref:Spore germination protein n=1 Tax=Oikeobacillus pervagus TaxID=1325931 RepID=A0AAJ1WGB9_9BACI|nr:hypothetical protein [Oikeobacillus pervagus]MDQ0214877.1 hypothetical protein [Oikeobacillus pervagus]